MSGKLKVHHPVGYPPQISRLMMAPRPASLEGKTVYLVDCRFDDGDILIEQMGSWFKDNAPEIKTEVRRKAGVYTERDEELYDEIKAKGAAAVMAVGH